MIRKLIFRTAKIMFRKIIFRENNIFENFNIQLQKPYSGFSDPQNSETAPLPGEPAFVPQRQLGNTSTNQPLAAIPFPVRWRHASPSDLTTMHHPRRMWHLTFFSTTVPLAFVPWSDVMHRRWRAQVLSTDMNINLVAWSDTMYRRWRT